MNAILPKSKTRTLTFNLTLTLILRGLVFLQDNKFDETIITLLTLTRYRRRFTTLPLTLTRFQNFHPVTFCKRSIGLAKPRTDMFFFRKHLFSHETMHDR